MTLVLSMASRDFVIQVADRRVTTFKRGTVACYDDNANKQTIYCNRMVFGYTGLAKIGATTTDVWLTTGLSKQNTSLFLTRCTNWRSTPRLMWVLAHSQLGVNG